MRQEGLVMLTVVIDRKGMPVKVEVEQSSGYQLLDKAALEAVRRWRFQPERIGNIPTESRVTIPVRFRLEE
ncbi:MAG: energy transducer TonB [Planctomycetia bacterium]|nr:energy transducer TonB [Planctomycetia bacterium]